MTKKIRTSRLSLMVCSLLVLAVVIPVVFKPRPAYACGICIEGVIETELEQWILDIVNGTYWRISRHVRSEFVAQKVWMVSIFWEDNLLPALMLMANQLSAVMAQQMQIVGSFMDAKQQLETQQILQKIAARTHKDYQSSITLCEIGSSVKSLGWSEHKAEVHATMFAQHSQDRYLGAVNTASAYGEVWDKQSRLKQYREKFCDPRDNNDGLQFLCDWDQESPPGPNIGGPAPERLNKDIDYFRTIDDPWTVNYDMISPSIRENLRLNGEEAMALAANLYGNEMFVRPTKEALQQVPAQRITNMQKAYVDLRSVVAKLAVAENSYNAILGMKGEGAAGSHFYLSALLEELGVGAGGGMALLGTIAPSYDAQMNVLTKKIYQNPDFYTNLYEKPANTKRKMVAMEAIGLMQKFDLFKSYLRTEASLSVLLEQTLIELQDEIENEINQMTGQ